MKKNIFFYVFVIIAFAFALYQYQKYKVVTNLDFSKLKLYKLDSSEYILFSNNQKYAYIVFWGTWCKPCVNEMPIINNVYNNNIDTKKWEFVTIAEEPIEKIILFNSRRNFTFSYSIAEKEFTEYNIFTYPTSYIVNNKFEILESWTGEISSEEELVLKLGKYE
jgi:thiol-disulfide isomerase/thioredoxin